MTEPDVKSEYLTAGEAARMLMVSPKTLVRWADAGRIPHAVTLGGHRRFSRTEVANMAQRMARGAGAGPEKEAEAPLAAPPPSSPPPLG